jgi:hypothetical protein
MGFISTGWLRLASGTEESKGEKEKEKEKGRCERRKTELISTSSCSKKIMYSHRSVSYGSWDWRLCGP